MKVRLAGILFIFVFALFSCEFLSRYIICRNFHTPFWRPDLLIYSFYPELHSLPDKLENDKINILILGGSAVTDSLCHISENLQKEFAPKGIKATIYNLAQFAHNTLDARIKFKHCKDLGFDYVFIYNGINDTRTNNCPDDVFHSDYSHIRFYSEVDIAESHTEIRYFSFPFLMDYCYNELMIKTGWKKTIPPEYIVVSQKMIGADMKNTSAKNQLEITKFLKENKDKILGLDMTPIDTVWWSDGKNIKSAGSFRKNLEYIYSNKPEKTKLILTDYAWYQPADYSLQKFLYQKLDYAEQIWPTEIYGKAENVAKGLRRHNQIIDSLANQHADIIYFNFNDSIPHMGSYFNDICHLAHPGQELLAHILAKEMTTGLKKPDVY